MCSGEPGQISPGETPIRDLLRWATGRLSDCLQDAPAGSAETPYLDALVLLSLATAEPIERLMASLRDEIGEQAAARFTRYLDQRCAGLPVSYIRGSKEFYGRDFTVTPAVLVPRPETELLVEIALDSLADPGIPTGAGPLHVHDACTGSGCIGITIAAERPDVIVSASDIDPAALEIAAVNRDRLVGRDRVALWESDLLDGASAEFRARVLPQPVIVTANPPYLSDTEYRILRGAGWPEPERALAGGPDGLDVVRRLIRGAVTVVVPGGYLMVEIGADQGEQCARVFDQEGFERVCVRQDLAGRDRVVTGVRP
jgi:release factor glutamine methyltransferase